MSAILDVTCDRCQERIHSDRAVLTLEAGASPPNWPTSVATGRPAVDLCPVCLDSLTKWLRESATTPTDFQLTGGSA